MQSGRQGTGTGADDADVADLWVRDPRTGEYRLRQPGDPAVVRTPAAPAARTAPGGPATAPSPGSPPPPGRAARRRSEQRPRSGPWVIGALCFMLAVGGTGGYLLLRHPSDGSTTAGGSAATGPAATASCAAHAAATGPVPEPAVSGTFLQGSKAEAINVRVTLLNGTGSIGTAETVLTYLQNRGYLRSSNGGPANATPHTTLVYAPDHVDQARTLAAELKLPSTALHGEGKTSDAIGRMVLTLGQDYHGIGKPFAAPVPAASASAGAGAKAGCGSQ